MIKKIQYFALRIFLTTMTVCAILVLFLVWSQGPDHFGVLNQIIITTFVVGLGSFLVWITTVILEIKEKIEKL